MKAIRIHKFGPTDEVLQYETVSTPVPGPQELLVKVEAASLNRADLGLRKGNYRISPDALPVIPGREIAGTVIEVGDDVKDFQIGQRVVAHPGLGGYAEYAVAKASQTRPIPEGVESEIAAAVPTVFLTAWFALLEGWAINREGHVTTDPEDMVNGGALLPLGSEREMGGHKGYALSAMVDILCSVLSGANWGPFAPPFALRQEIPTRSVGKGIGHFFGAVQIDGFIDKDEFKRQIDEWIRVFRNTKPAPGTDGPLIPGDPEREAEAIRSKEGIPLIKPVVDDLLDISQQTGIHLEAN